MPPPAEAEEQGKNAKDKIMERLRRGKYYCGRDGRVPSGRRDYYAASCGDFFRLTVNSQEIVNA